MTDHRWLLPPLRAVGRRQINKAIDDPSCARKVTPTRRGRLQAGDAHRRVVSDADQAQRRPGHRADRGDHAGRRSATADGDRAPGRRARARHRLPVARLRRADGDRRARRPRRWRRSGRACRAPTWASAFPTSPTCSCSTGRTRTAAPARSSTRSRRACSTSSPRCASSTGPTRGGSSCAAQAAERFDRELREALAGTVWHTGCTSWYVDENGNDPSQWPWLWSSYRRRTAQARAGRVRAHRRLTRASALTGRRAFAASRRAACPRRAPSECGCRTCACAATAPGHVESRR